MADRGIYTELFTLQAAAYLGNIDGDRPGSAEPFGSARST
jgi:hypothetical protein